MDIEFLFIVIVYVIGAIIGFLYGKEIKENDLKRVYAQGYKQGKNDIIEFVEESLKK